MVVGYSKDAEGAGKFLLEIIYKARPKIWRFESNEEEARYVKWLATWAFHWASLEQSCRDKNRAW